MPVHEQQEGLEVIHAAPSGAEAEVGSERRELEIARGREELLRQQVALLEERLLEAETRIADKERAAERALALVDEIQRTSSWRVTAPLRAVRRLLGRS